MANQALIQAAARMYSAKAAKAQKDITPILQGVNMATTSVIKALDEKKQKQEEEVQKEFQPFTDIVLENDAARSAMTRELDALHDEYYDSTIQSEGIFVGKDKKFEAAQNKNKIANTLKAWETDLKSVDLNKAIPSNTSDYNDITARANEVGYKDKTLADNLIFHKGDEERPAGVYTKDFEGNMIRLSKYEQPVQKNVKGFETMVKQQAIVSDAGRKGEPWKEEVLPSISYSLNNLMDGNNWQSLLFDDIWQGFNWANEEVKNIFPEVKDDPEALKEKRNDLRVMVKNGLDKDGKPFDWKKEFTQDVINGFKIDYDNAAAKRELENTAKPSRQKTPLSELQELKINTFINSVNRGGDIKFPNGDIGKKVNGRIQLYKKSGEKYDGIAPISIDEAMDRADIPADMRSKVLSGSVSSSAVLAGENPEQPKTSEEIAQDLIKLYSTKK